MFSTSKYFQSTNNVAKLLIIAITITTNMQDYAMICSYLPGNPKAGAKKNNFKLKQLM